MKRNCGRVTERGKEAAQDDLPGTKGIGASEGVAKQVAANSRRWWRNSARLLKTSLTISYFDQQAMPRLS